MKGFFLGILLIILIGFGGLVYRNATEHPSKQIACPLDAKVCPDGTAVGRTGMSCSFLECPLPNTTLEELKLAFAIPDGFEKQAIPETGTAVTYFFKNASSTDQAKIMIREFAVTGSSTPLQVIQNTAIGGASGAPVDASLFSSKMLGERRYTVVMVERSEGVIDTAYYLVRGDTVLRFDAIDTGVSGWTQSNLTTDLLRAHAGLIKMIDSLQMVQ